MTKKDVGCVNTQMALLQQGNNALHQSMAHADAESFLQKKNISCLLHELFEEGIDSKALMVGGEADVSSSFFKLKCLQFEALCQLSYSH